MRCKMCGAELKKEGELCNNCMNKVLKEEEKRADRVKVYEFKRKFVFGYQLSQHLESLFIAIIVCAVLILTASEFLLESIIFIILVILAEIFVFLYDKYKINHSKCTFYMTKFVYKKIVFFKEKKIEISYTDVKEISYNQTRFEKIFGIGTIYIKTASKNLLEKHIYIDSIKNVDKVFNDIKEKLGTGEENNN